MEAVFIKLLNMSITAGWLILAVLLLHILLRKAPKAMQCGLWALVGIRLICPVSFESVLSLVPSTEIVPREIVQIQESAAGSGAAAMDPATVAVEDSVISSSHMAEADALPVQTMTSLPPDHEPEGGAGLRIAANVWLAGMAVMLLYLTVSYVWLRHRVKTAMRLEGNLWICDHIESPFILGILFPRVYLPSDLDEGRWEAVIAHEKAHLKRHDHWWKPLGYLLLSVYWFNPFIWVAYILLCRDIELACDEHVIRKMDAEGKKNYAEVLLSYSVSGCAASARSKARCPLAFGEVGVKVRVKAVLNYRKPAFWAVAIAALACIVVGVCFLTNPVSRSRKVFGARYSVREIVYDAPQYDFTYTVDSAPEFVLTADFALMERGGINSGDTWTNMGACVEVDYSRRELSSLLVSPYDENKTQEMFGQVKRVWRADTGDENDTFYLVMQAGEEQLFVAQGYDNESEAHIRWLFQMEKQSAAYGAEEFYEEIRDICKGRILRISLVELDTKPQCIVAGFMAENDEDDDNSDGNNLQDYDMGFAAWLYDAGTDSYVNRGYKIFEGETSVRYYLGQEWGIDRDVTVILESGDSYDEDGKKLVGQSNDFTRIVYDGQEAKGNDSSIGNGEQEEKEAVGMENAGYEEDKKSFPDLDAAVCAAILGHYASGNSADYFCCESHNYLGSDTVDAAAGEGETKQEVTACCMALYQELTLSFDGIEVAKQVYYPVALTFSFDRETGYALKEFRDFRQEREESLWLYEEFPAEWAEKIAEVWASPKYMDELVRACYKQAVQKGQVVDTYIAVGKLFDTITSKHLVSSNYLDYITASPQEYEALRYYGDYTLEYIFLEFLKGGQTDLSGKLMQAVMEDLTGESSRLYNGTGQEYFDEWLAAARKMETEYGMDWMKENKPYQWRALQRLANEKAGRIELENLGCTVELPENWSGKYYIFYGEGEGWKSAAFFQKATYDKYGSGSIFWLERIEEGQMEMIFGIPPEIEIIAEVNGDYFVCVTPSDVQYPIWADADEEDAAIAAEYEDMFKDIESICSSLYCTPIK